MAPRHPLDASVCSVVPYAMTSPSFTRWLGTFWRWHKTQVVGRAYRSNKDNGTRFKAMPPVKRRVPSRPYSKAKSDSSEGPTMPDNESPRNFKPVAMPLYWSKYDTMYTEVPITMVPNDAPYKNPNVTDIQVIFGTKAEATTATGHRKAPARIVL